MTNGSSHMIFEKQWTACEAAVWYGFAKALRFYLQQTKRLMERLYALKNNARPYCTKRSCTWVTVVLNKGLYSWSTYFGDCGTATRYTTHKLELGEAMLQTKAAC